MTPPDPAAVAAALATARQCAQWDPNPETRGATEALLAAAAAAAGAAAVEEALDRFGSRVEFGTAGLRAPMGAGTSRMNDLIVLQTAQGLADYICGGGGADGAALAAAAADGAGPPLVVIGYDHRARGAINSRRFALLTAAACLRRGLRVSLYARLACTPLVPFAVLRLRAAAGVMVTASHNPKDDNGYKVYWSTGAQIVAPHDAGIAAAIERNLAPWPGADYALAGGEAAGEAALRAHARCLPDATDALAADYVAAATAALSERRGAGAGAEAAAAAAPPAAVRVCYTAMHGVGLPFARAMFAAFGLPPFAETPEQVQPDASFPTVAFPNPEEGKGALKLAMAAADREGCSLILANDPDADRLAVAEWAPADGVPARRAPPADAGAAAGADAGEWRVFTGNEIGALLASWCWRRHVARGGVPEGCVMIASTVSSKFVQALARAEGFAFDETLTGFKWMGTRMSEHAAAGRTVLFAFEEAIGFCCGDRVVRDKDGVSAAAVFADMANALAAEGLTAAQELDRLYVRYGRFASLNGYIVVDKPAKTEAIFARLRNEGRYCLRLGPGLDVRALRDLTGAGFDSSAAGGAPTLPTSAANMLTFKLSNGVVLTLRSSGTEPKLKWYAEREGAPGTEEVALRTELQRTVQLLVDEVLQPERWGLKRPLGF
jgi:phosphomannomutase